MRYAIQFCLIFITAAASGQNHRDSVKQTVMALNQVYPGIRPYSIQFERPSSRDYKTRLFKEEYENGVITDNYRIRTAIKFPLYLERDISVYGSLNHLYQHISLGETNNTSNSLPAIAHSKNYDLHDLSLSVTVVHKDSVANKPLIISSTAMLNSRNLTTAEKLKFIFTASVVFKATRNTVITAGLVGIIDPSTQIPIAPTFTYWHRFQRSQWQLDFVLPSKISVRRPVLGKGWFTIGTELSGTHSFITPNQPFLSGDYEHSSLLIQSGVNFEYPVSKHLLLGLKSGVEHALTSRLVELNERSTRYVGSSSLDPSMFFNLSLSYIPGLRKK